MWDLPKLIQLHSSTFPRQFNALIILQWDYNFLFLTRLELFCEPNVQFVDGNTELRNKPLMH